MEKTYTVKKVNPSTVEVTVTISKDSVKKSYETLLEKEVKNTNAKGFRKGKTPKELVESQLKPQILFEVFNRLAPLHLSNIVNTEKIELIAAPEYKELPKLELDQDIVFTVNLTVMPEFKLGNMKKVKVTMGSFTVDDKEVEEIITKLSENKGITAKKGTKEFVNQSAKLLSFGDVKDMDELKYKIKKTLVVEKESVIRRQAENDALNQAIKLSNIEVPDPAVHYEAHEREHSFKHQLEHMKMTIEKYVETVGTTVEQMVDMWHKDAKEALETDVFLKLYAKEKNLSISDKELDDEIEKVKKQNPNQSTSYDDPEWKEYIRRVSLKQKAYTQFLSEVMPKK